MSDCTSWTVGMKVVCIDDAPTTLRGVMPSGLIKGRTYTVNAISIALRRHHKTGAEWEMVVVAVDGARHPYSTGGTYGALRFRRAQTRKTSIAIFERIRDNPKAPIIEPSPKQRERV